MVNADPTTFTVNPGATSPRHTDDLVLHFCSFCLPQAPICLDHDLLFFFPSATSTNTNTEKETRINALFSARLDTPKAPPNDNYKYTTASIPGREQWARRQKRTEEIDPDLVSSRVVEWLSNFQLTTLTFSLDKHTYSSVSVPHRCMSILRSFYSLHWSLSLSLSLSFFFILTAQLLLISHVFIFFCIFGWARNWFAAWIRSLTCFSFHSPFQANAIPYVHPLLRSHPNWTLDSDEFRSRTDPNSSVQNLLDGNIRRSCESWNDVCLSFLSVQWNVLVLFAVERCVCHLWFKTPV